MTPTKQRDFAGTTIRFQVDGQPLLNGLIRQGEQLSLQYDPQRTTGCRGYHDGMPAWDIFGSVRFLPGGEIMSGNLVQHYSSGGGGKIFDPPLPVPLTVAVPADATQAEIWFLNRNVFGCASWDSQLGKNYNFDVAQAGPALPVMFRTGAERSLEMVNVFSETGSKYRKILGAGASRGSELETHLSLTAWVRNLTYRKNVWIDLHVFDPDDNLASAQTLTLSYSGSAEGNGDFFALNQMVFQGSGGVPGSVWPRPDARRLQYRLYYEVNGRVFTDGMLHQQTVEADAAVSNAVAAAA